MTEIAPRFRILSTQLLSVLFAKYLSKHVHGHPPKQLPRCTRPTSHCRYLGANSYGKMNTCELQESQRFKFISYMLDLYIYIYIIILDKNAFQFLTGFFPSFTHHDHFRFTCPSQHLKRFPPPSFAPPSPGSSIGARSWGCHLQLIWAIT